MSKSIEQRGEKPYYVGIPYEALRRVALTANEGFHKYDKGNVFEQNFKVHYKPADFMLMFNHAVDHLYKALDEIQNGKIHDGGEDHLAHAMYNIGMIIWATENGMLPNKIQLIENYIVQAKAQLEAEQYDSAVEQALPEPPQEEKPAISEKAQSVFQKILGKKV